MNSRITHLLLFLIVFLCVALAYQQVYFFEFINFDDNIYVTQNEVVAAGLSWEGVKWAFSTTLGGHWHPLSWLAHMLDVSLFGMHAGAHHMVNALLHALNCALLYLFLSSAFRNRGVAFISALLFGLHPLRLESVAWISERKDVLSMFFGLLAANLYLRFVVTRRALPYFFSLCAFALTLLAKPTFITLPVLFLLIDIWPLNRCAALGERSAWNSQLKRVLVEKIPFLLVSILFTVTTLLAQRAGGGLRTFDEMSIVSRFETAIPGYLAYLGKLIWPAGLAIFYPHVTYESGVVAGALIGLLAITWLCYAYRYRAPHLLFGWLWFLIALLPMSGIVAIGGQAFADRWTYLAHIGPIVALVALSYVHYNQKVFRVWSIVILALAFMTVQNLPNWRTSETVFRQALNVNPNNFMAHTNLGVALMEAGKGTEAAFHYEEAVRLNPTYPEALNNLGIARANKGRLVEALQAFDKALSIRPDFVTAQRNKMQAERDIQLMRARLQ
jgi:hypothetical protein